MSDRSKMEHSHHLVVSFIITWFAQYCTSNYQWAPMTIKKTKYIKKLFASSCEAKHIKSAYSHGKNKETKWEVLLRNKSSGDGRHRCFDLQSRHHLCSNWISVCCTALPERKHYIEKNTDGETDTGTERNFKMWNNSFKILSSLPKPQPLGTKTGVTFTNY